jgi:hypothetical protein
MIHGVVRRDALAFDRWKQLTTTKIEERREMWVPRRLNNMGYLNILHDMGADLGSVFGRRNKCPPGGMMVTGFVPNPLVIVLPLVTPFVVTRLALVARYT